MIRPLLSLFAVSSSLLVACSPVRTVTPIAKETEISLQEEFQGTWRMGDGVFHIAFDEESIGRIAWIEWKGNEFVTRRGKFNALRSKDEEEAGFISIQMEDEAEDGVYLLGAFKLIEPDSILFWEADPFSRYESLLGDEKLEGEIKKADSPSKMIIFADGSELVSKIDSFSEHFDLERPILMTRAVPKSNEASSPN